MYARDTAGIATPIGIVTVIGTDDAIESIRIDANGTAARASAAAVRDAIDQLDAWFAGIRQHFNLRLAPSLTSRGQALRDGMIAIPYSETLSYGALSARLGSSPRAIGQACARNPFPIVVPCHRVLASNGPGQYSAGSGIVTKSWLLDHEQHYRGAFA